MLTTITTPYGTNVHTSKTVVEAERYVNGIVTEFVECGMYFGDSGNVDTMTGGRMADWKNVTMFFKSGAEVTIVTSK